MTDAQAMRLCISLHTRTVVGLLDAVTRAGNDPIQRTERLALIRDAVIEFKTEFNNAFLSTPETKS